MTQQTALVRGGPPWTPLHRKDLACWGQPQSQLQPQLKPQLKPQPQPQSPRAFPPMEMMPLQHPQHLSRAFVPTQTTSPRQPQPSPALASMQTTSPGQPQQSSLAFAPREMMSPQQLHLPSRAFPPRKMTSSRQLQQSSQAFVPIRTTSPRQAQQPSQALASREMMSMQQLHQPAQAFVPGQATSLQQTRLLQRQDYCTMSTMQMPFTFGDAFNERLWLGRDEWSERNDQRNLTAEEPLCCLNVVTRERRSRLSYYGNRSSRSSSSLSPVTDRRRAVVEISTPDSEVERQKYGGLLRRRVEQTRRDHHGINGDYFKKRKAWENHQKYLASKVEQVQTVQQNLRCASTKKKKKYSLDNLPPLIPIGRTSTCQDPANADLKQHYPYRNIPITNQISPCVASNGEAENATHRKRDTDRTADRTADRDTDRNADWRTDKAVDRAAAAVEVAVEAARKKLLEQEQKLLPLRRRECTPPRPLQLYQPYHRFQPRRLDQQDQKLEQSDVQQTSKISTSSLRAFRKTETGKSDHSGSPPHEDVQMRPTRKLARHSSDVQRPASAVKLDAASPSRDYSHVPSPVRDAALTSAARYSSNKSRLSSAVSTF